MIYKDPEAICLRNSKMALTNFIGQTVLDLLIKTLINKSRTTGPKLNVIFQFLRQFA